MPLIFAIQKIVMRVKNKSYERCMFNQMKPISATCILHILQWQASAFHTLISPLNSCKDSLFAMFWGTMAHILIPRNLTDCMSWCVVFLFFLLNWLDSERKLYYGSRKSNTCFIVSGDKLFFTLKIYRYRFWYLQVPEQPRGLSDV